MLIARHLALSAGLILLGLLVFFGSRFAVQQLTDGSTESEHPPPLVVGLANTPAPAPPSWPTRPPSALEEETTSGSESSEVPLTAGSVHTHEESSGSSQESSTPEPHSSPSRTTEGSEGSSEIIEEGVVGG